MIKCIKCGETKRKDLFVKNKTCKDGVANTCKKCRNHYSKLWKQANSIEINERNRVKYAETNGAEVKKRDEARKKNKPFRFRCQVLRGGMRDRAKLKSITFDSDFFTVEHLMERLTKNPNCECCDKKLDLGYKDNKRFNDDSPSMDRVDSSKGYTKNNVAILCWRCNKHKQDSTSNELRVIADFMDRFLGDCFGDGV